MGSGQSTNRYNRLQPSSNSLKQPLLGYDNECMERQQHEIEQNQKKNAALEKEIRDLKARVSKFELKAQSNASKPSPPPSLPLPPKTLAIEKQKTDTTLEKEVNELKIRVAKLELLAPVSPLMKKQEEAIETIKKKNAALEGKIKELTTIVDQMNAVEPKPEITSPSMNDLLGCQVVLIFLISFLIGVSLRHIMG